LKHVVGEIEANGLETRRVALSDSPLLGVISRDLEAQGHEIAMTPSASDLFQFDVGITSAQAAIAETGTLVLEQARERNRLVSLLPPVHIAIVNAGDICATMSEAITRARKESDTSSAITFITGPSRTADIELTLTIGVHGPKELYVIVYRGNH
jgi:L-lactate dehydrogenase complex protein LldG